MDVLALLKRAESVGVRVEVKGEDLIVRGPKKYSEVAKELGNKKREIVDFFNAHLLATLAPTENLHLGRGDTRLANPEEIEPSVASISATDPQPGDAKAPSLKDARPLVGGGFPSIPTTIPPASILSTAVRCRCDRYLVQPELRGMTGGVCWPCFERGAL